MGKEDCEKESSKDRAVDRNSTFTTWVSASHQEKFKSTFTEIKQADSKSDDPSKEETKTKRYSDKRKEERLKREREKAEKNKKKDDIIDIEDEMTDDASVRDDASMADDISVKSDSKSVLAEVKDDLKKAKETREIKVRALSGKAEEKWSYRNNPFTAILQRKQR